MQKQMKFYNILSPNKAERKKIMKEFEKTLQAAKDFDSTMKMAQNTFKTVMEEINKTYKEPLATNKLREAREVLDKTKFKARQVAKEIVNEDFESVREKIRKIATAAAPDGFVADIETIRAMGNSISRYEVTSYIQKYKGSYAATRAIYETIYNSGKGEYLKGYCVLRPDSLENEMQDVENMVLNWIRSYNSNSYTTALMINHTNPITSLAERVQSWLEGGFLVSGE